MEAKHVERYDVDAWIEDLSNLYYGYGKGDDVSYDPESAMVRNFCVNRMVEQIIAMNGELRRRRNILIAVGSFAAFMFLCWFAIFAYLMVGR